MKRDAERQLTKDEIEGGYVDPEETPDAGFRKAPDEILKTRVIRALPNRTKHSGTQANSINGTTATVTPLFPPSVASSGSTFTLAPTVPTNSSASPTTYSPASINNSSSTRPNPFGISPLTSSSFSSTTQTSVPPKTAFSFPSSSDTPTPSVPSSTSKAFASVLSNSNTSIFGPSSPSNLTSSSNQAAPADEDDPDLFKYYLNLRGLNHSLLSAISKGVEDDPFANMSGILESYNSARLRIQNDTSTSLLSAPSVQPSPLVFASSTTPAMFSSSNETSTKPLFGAPSEKSSFFKPEQTSSTPAKSAFGSTSSPFKFGGSIADQSSAYTFGSSKATSTFKWDANADQPATGDLNGAEDNSSSKPTASNVLHFQFGSGSGEMAQSQLKTTPSADKKTANDAAVGEGSEQATPTTERDRESNENVSNLLAVHNPHDDEGEGEENELTIHAIKVKAYRMRKADAEGGPGWADLGFGILRLKKDKDTNARRMLLRNSTNGKILINFKIYSGLKPSLVKKALTFVGHDNGLSQTYCVRVPGEEQAQQLKEALDKEIESVTVKNDE